MIQLYKTVAYWRRHCTKHSEIISCGLAAGSSVTILGTPKHAHKENMFLSIWDWQKAMEWFCGFTVYGWVARA